MFDDSQTNNTTDNQTNDNGAQPAYGLGGAGTGAIDDPTTAAPQNAPEVVHPEEEHVQDTPKVDSGSDQVQADSGELSDLKRQALEQLSPLVHKLDQSPEDKYKTLMMMIQASDNQELLKEAYDTAQKIEDETVKAQALLNIVNEINYFTQKG